MTRGSPGQSRRAWRSLLRPVAPGTRLASAPAASKGMGYWSTAMFGNDLASDVRGSYREVLEDGIPMMLSDPEARP